MLPGVKEAYLSRFASSLQLLIKSGCNLQTSLGLMRQLERGTPMEAELAQWQSRVAQGHGTFGQMTSGGTRMPPLFLWMVSSEGEDWVTGLTRAAETYYLRAVYKTDLLLNAAMPVAILFLGALIFMQLFSMMNLMSEGTFPFGFVQGTLLDKKF
jgi:type II secretory pathway component PulF